jgi:CMP-N-acetylneuraminic acid synthetase
MKTIAIIPARGGSKRLPEKNTKLLGEIPLLAHSILYAKQNNAIIDEIYVSTNDDKIKKIALEYGAKVIDRPESLSGDLEPTVTALKHVLESIEYDVDNVILLQPTNPLRPENLLKDGFDFYLKGNHDSLFTVSRNHQKFGKITDGKFVPFNYEIGQRSQELEPLFFENGLLYIAKSEKILSDIIISKDACPFEINHIFASVDIDTQEDFDYAQYLYLLNDKKQ